MSSWHSARREDLGEVYPRDRDRWGRHLARTALYPGPRYARRRASEPTRRTHKFPADALLRPAQHFRHGHD